MADGLKDKTVSGLIWSFSDNICATGIRLVVSIVLARLLSPEEFGLIGMTAIFIALSSTLANSGFREALIRKQNCTNADYSTVFFFKVLVSIVLFWLLYLSAEHISRFFEQPELVEIVRVLSVVLVIESLTIIQGTILIKRINFRTLMNVSVVSTVASGAIAITMAVNGYGVWSLVAGRIGQSVVHSLLLAIWCRWVPSLIFSVASFKELFGFGSKLLVSAVIDSIFRNIYNVVVGKYYSATELGFFDKARGLKSMPSETLSLVVGRVCYPVLSGIQDDVPRLKAGYRKIIRSTMFVTLVLMMGLAAVSEPLVITMFGEKWRPAIEYLQLLCFVGMWYPLHALNLNMLKVQGRSDRFLILEVIKKLLAIPIIIVGVMIGIKAMIVGMIVNSVLSYLLNSYWSGQMIGYSVRDQVKDILPSFILASVVGAAVFMLGEGVSLDYPVMLVVQVVSGACLTIGICEVFRLRDYLFMKEVVLEKLRKKRGERLES